MELKEIIEKAWDNRALLEDIETKIAIKTIIDDLDQGSIRVAEPIDEGVASQ
jgi:2,3,4,5-tetrahydropyridine-2-carboxylate N-succinyltransferase